MYYSKNVSSTRPKCIIINSSTNAEVRALHGFDLFKWREGNFQNYEWAIDYYQFNRYLDAQIQESLENTKIVIPTYNTIVFSYLIKNAQMNIKEINNFVIRFNFNFKCLHFPQIYCEIEFFITIII